MPPLPPHQLKRPRKYWLDRVESAFQFHHRLIIDVIDCSRYCSGYFQVAKANENSHDDSEDNGDEGSQGQDEERDGEEDEGGDEDKDEERGEDEDEDINEEEIVSPASYVSHGFGRPIK